MRKRTCVAAALLIAAVSIQSLKSLPWFSFWGLDFLNIWLFQHCPASVQPYGIPGSACGDPLGRDLFYPPLLFNSFAWVRWFPVWQWAYLIWAGMIAASIAGAFAFWGRTRTWVAILFLALVYFQYPSVFALERGNTDAGPLLLVLAACALWVRGRRFGPGLAVGLAASFKLYPAFTAAVVGAGAVGLSMSAGIGAALFPLAGIVLGVALPCVLFPTQSRVYFGEVLPQFAMKWNLPSLANHSILPRFADHVEIGRLVCAMLLGAWMVRAWRSLRDAPEFVFAGALAMSTYFSGLSEDYNLITAYPLLFLQMRGAFGEGEDRVVRRERWLFILGVVGVFGHRQVFVGNSVYVQLAWLVLTAIAGPARPAVVARERAIA